MLLSLLDYKARAKSHGIKSSTFRWKQRKLQCKEPWAWRQILWQTDFSDDGDDDYD